MQITAALLSGVGQPFEITTLTLDDPGPGEVRVRLATSGVCASDAHTRSGRIPSPTPSVLGHEGAGVVESVGAGVTHVRVGDHVALSWMPSCGACRHCQRGRPVLCTAAAPALLAGTMLDGSVRLHDAAGRPVHHYSFLSTFATHTVVPAASAVPIPADVPLAVASIVGCAVLTGYGAVVNQARVTPGSSVVVFGGGGVGLAAVVAARVGGAAQVIVVDPLESKRTAALGFGATHVLAPSPVVAEQVRALTGGDGADYGIDATGSQGVVAQAFDAVVAGGTVVCVGVPAPGVDPVLPGANLVRSEKTVVGSLYGSSRPGLDIPAVLDLYMGGLLPLDRMITKAFRLDEVDTAFDELRAGTLGKGVLVLDPELAGPLPVEAPADLAVPQPVLVGA
ncbi:zinc-binding dehydrogenase [Nocardioides sp. CFH 31398]|uniref:zinc-binding dehydrogenase n=1 Tax=Nocardioides sp. CFH 31398 TaxID=2919579 RepID=UPI001F0709FF|nr:zinc-binding dehydrogenase [Nocardioides sp. CFH 31398]MCH1867975.1 zinc-binding dehydrogenase [Nocardioides sp. CFH 31398]